jgi:lactoylglutathione lyase
LPFWRAASAMGWLEQGFVKSMISLNLVVIRSPNPDRAIFFYQLLGLEFVKHRHGQGVEHYTCEMGPIVFEIYPADAAIDTTTAPRLGFVVDNIDGIWQKLVVAGVEILVPPRDSVWGRRMVTIDFDGYRVELVQKAFNLTLGP